MKNKRTTSALPNILKADYKDHYLFIWTFATKFSKWDWFDTDKGTKRDVHSNEKVYELSRIWNAYSLMSLKISKVSNIIVEIEIIKKACKVELKKKKIPRDYFNSGALYLNKRIRLAAFELWKRLRLY